jgi:serine protease Do
VVVAERPVAAKAAMAPGQETGRQLGLVLSATESGAGRDGRGAMVIGIDTGGFAAGRGINLGDVILDVAGRGVASPTDVYQTIAEAQKAGKRSVLLRVRSGDNARFIALPIG